MRATALALLVCVSACGSRSRLLEPGPSAGGAGGSGATSGAGGSFGGGGFGGGLGGNGGSGGVGGGVACTSLFQFAASVTVEHDAKDQDSAPELVFSSDDGEQVSVAFVRQPLESSRQLRHATLSPWSDFPLDGKLAPAYATFESPQLSAKFRAGSGLGDHLSLLVAHEAGPSTFTTFAPMVAAQASSAGPTVGVQGSTPAFVARGAGGRHLVGARDDGLLWGHIVQGGSVVQSGIVGCAAFAPIADAVQFGDGWLVAVASGQNPPGGGCENDPGPPTRVDIVRVHPNGKSEFVIGVDAGAPVMHVAAAPHPDGLYVVYRVASGGVVAPIRWMRVAALSAGIIGPGDLSGPADFPLEFDATSLGDRLVVAWGNDPAGNPADLVVTLLDPFGALLAQHAWEPEFFGPVSVLGAPLGNSLLVAWQGPSPALVTGVSLTRLDCFGDL